jgi:diguanylate cyclase (GGDEF)-like protein/PAS domain S-box-containing protein
VLVTWLYTAPAFAQASVAAGPGEQSTATLSAALQTTGSTTVLQGVIVGSRQPGGFDGREYIVGDGAALISLRVPREVLDQLPSPEAYKAGALVNARAELQFSSAGDLWFVVRKPADLNLKLLPLDVALSAGRAPAPKRAPVTRALHDKDTWIEASLAALALAAALSLLVYRKRTKAALLISSADRDRAEEALRKGHTRLQHLLSSNSAVIYSLVPQASDLERFTFVSENVEQLLGYAAEHCIRARGWLRDCIHPDDLPLVESGMRTVLNKGTLDREFRFLRKGGSYVWIHDNQRLVRDSDGNVTEIVGTWMDITERKWSEKLKEVFASLGARLAAVSTPKDAAAFILRAADVIFGWDAAMVALYHEESEELRAIINFDTMDGRKQEIPATSTEVRPLSRAVLAGEARLVLRTPGVEDPATVLGRFGAMERRSESLMFAPIAHNNKVIGILTIQSYTERAYDNRDLQVLQTLANYCSAALIRTFAEEERKQAQDALRDSEQRYALALRGANDGLWDWDFRTNRIYFSPRWKNMLGLSEAELSDNPEDWKSLIHLSDVARVRNALTGHLQGSTPQLEVEYRMRHKDGSYRWMLLRGVAVRGADGKPLRMAGSMTDVTQRRNAEQQLLQGAYYDGLTALPNRLLFLEQLRRALGRAERRGDFVFAVLFLDLDRFKVINDSLGHLVGDKLLISVAERLRICVRPEDMVARLGGDEFTVLLEDVSDPSQATRVAERIQEEISKPFQLEGHEVWTTASIGIAFSSTGYDKPEDILRDADAAMYRAKAKGKARHELFDQEMHSRALHLLQTEAELRRALERQELCVFYQPLVELSTRKISGFEALVRWQHPERGLVMPGDFISIAEETGLIVPLGAFVLESACRQLREWQAFGADMQQLTVSVNVSRKQFSQPDFVSRVQQILEQTEVMAGTLALEITESMLLEHTEALIRVLNELKSIGLQLQIDDFGTGYSSLAYLHRFPIDKLKVDRSFVGQIGEAPRNAEIVRAIVTLARGLDMETIAEGIETVEQAEFVQSLNCRYGQGYLLGKPLSARDATALVHNAVALFEESVDPVLSELE